MCLCVFMCRSRGGKKRTIIGIRSNCLLIAVTPGAAVVDIPKPSRSRPGGGMIFDGTNFRSVIVSLLMAPSRLASSFCST